jgi:GNAT superfamily N-acetyltransferase
VTEDSYRTVMNTWPCQRELDWIIEASDGTFAARCLSWPDEVNGVDELEPVGTGPRFRRLGLGRAVCLAALRALRDTGATRAVVYPVEGGPKSPGALPLYQDLGFRPYGRTPRYTRARLTADRPTAPRPGLSMP